MFQRSAWLGASRVDYEVPRAEKFLMRHFPLLQRLRRARQRWQREMTFPALLNPGRSTAALEAMCQWHLRRQVLDEQICAKLTPRDRWGCKRPILSSDYLRTFMRPNVELVTDLITEVRPRSSEHPC